jgi:hypothetical protein
MLVGDDWEDLDIYRWEDNIKMYPKETLWCGMEWINLAQDMEQLRALVNMVMNLHIP